MTWRHFHLAVNALISVFGYLFAFVIIYVVSVLNNVCVAACLNPELLPKNVDVIVQSVHVLWCLINILIEKFMLLKGLQIEFKVKAYTIIGNHAKIDIIKFNFNYY